MFEETINCIPLSQQLKGMKKVLVTGGAGFIGSHTVVELHEAGYTPVIVDNFCNSHPDVLDGIATILGHSPIHHNIDCTDEQAMRGVFAKEGPFVGVIHFAAFKAVGASVNDPLSYYRNNVHATEILLRIMSELDCTNLVFSSSCTVYGQPKQLPVTEQTAFQHANSPYGYTKQVCERMIQDVVAAPSSATSAVLLRYFNPIGAHPSGAIGELPIGVPENLIPYITQTAAGKRKEIVIFGDDYETSDGTCVRDYIHVVDLAKAHVAALHWLTGKSNVCDSFNLGTGEGNTVKEVIDTFVEATGTQVPHRIGDRRPGDVEKIWASATKAQEELGWKTTLSLKTALIDAWNWQQKLEEQ